MVNHSGGDTPFTSTTDMQLLDVGTTVRLKEEKRKSDKMYANGYRDHKIVIRIKFAKVHFLYQKFEVLHHSKKQETMF